MFENMMQPDSLYKIALSFVAKNIIAVESFHGFPSVIAEQIFDQCLRVGSLDYNTDGTRRVLAMFAQEYSTEFASSLACHSLNFLVEFQESLVALFPPLQKLDLSCCQLGRYPSSLVHNLHHLQHLSFLSLRENELSEDTLRKLTLPVLMDEGAFKALTDLDVSLNDITYRALSGLLRLPKLCRIRFSITTNRLDHLKNIKDRLKFKGFVLSEDRVDIEVFESPCQNCGWGLSILAQWQKKMNEFEEARKVKCKPRPSTSFYGFHHRKDPLYPTPLQPRLSMQTFIYVYNQGKSRFNLVGKRKDGLKRSSECTNEMTHRKKCHFQNDSDWVDHLLNI